MKGLDALLNKAILESIQKEVDTKKLKRIERGLEERGVGFSEFVYKFGQINAFEFESELKEIEDLVLRDFLSVEEESGETWLAIRNRHLVELILKTFADEDKKMILDHTGARSETIPKVLITCNLPNTSGYRKVRQLIDDGFVVATGLAETFEGRRALLYRSIIQKIQININKDYITARIVVPKDVLASSSIVKTLLELNEGRRAIAN